MKRISLCLALLVMFVFFPVQNADALSCAEPSHPKVEMGHSEIVFKGKLISSTKSKLHFEVFQVWKGQIGKELTLYQNYWTEFVPGQEYIVFAGKDEGELRPKLCGNTGPASEEIEQQLGETIPMVESETTPGWGGILSTAVGSVLLVGIVVYWLRKKPRVEH